VTVPVFNAYEDVLECIDSLLESTRPDTPILILDDASTDDRIPNTLEPLSHSRGFAYVRKSANSGFVGTVNLAFEWCAPRDVVVVNSDVIVPPGWLGRLQAAAYFRSTIATATPFTNHGSILSVPYRNRPINYLVGGMTAAQVDACIKDASLMLRPIIPTAVGHCIYFKRSALDVVGYFDEAFSPGYGEETDFSQRAVAAGFSHVVADDLFVFHKGSRSFDLKGQEKRRSIQESHEEIINTRYPWYRQWVVDASSDFRSPLALALERARAAILGYRIAIDATIIGGATTGTQVLTLELIRALATAPARREYLAVIIGDAVPTEALLGVDQLVDEVIRFSSLQHLEQPLFDLIHRPFQIRSAEDLIFLQKVAHRFIVSQLDFIAFSNPSYADSPEEWVRYRYLTQLTFACADGIAFISNNATQDAAHQGLRIPEDGVCVTHVGVNHLLHSIASTPPVESSLFEDQPFILMLGTNFKHKNRVYALKLFKVLIQKYQWPGRLVFAGPNVSCGGSVAEEALERLHNPELQSRVHYLGAVGEAEKGWLLENAALVLYPSTYEGFGLVPFEAAAAGTPVLTTRSTSLSEALGDQVIYLDTLNPEVGAEMAWSLLSDPEIAARQVGAVQARTAAFTWSDVAGRTWDFYRRILKTPPRFRETTRLFEDTPDWKRRGPPPSGETPVEAWRRHIVLAFHVWRTEGFRPLLYEIRQYIRWRLV
jgi:glycosyltransferase involved in cell wall biosynthesis